MNGRHSVAELFASGRIVDLILGLTVLEGIALVIHRRRTGRGLAAAGVIHALVPGIFLLLALRTVLAGAWWVWTAACLLAAFVTHLMDLRHRKRG